MHTHTTALSTPTCRAMDEQPPPPADQSTWDATKTWIRYRVRGLRYRVLVASPIIIEPSHSNNKLKTIFGIWAGGIGATLAYEMTKPSSLSMKIIHARVVAQVLTLACLAGAAGADYLEHRSSTTNVRMWFPAVQWMPAITTTQELEVAKQRIMDLEQKLERTFLGKK